MKRYIKSETFDDTIVIYYKHKKVFEGDIGYAYDDLLYILQKDTETKDSVIEYLNSFGDPSIYEYEYDDIDTIVSTLIGMISITIAEDYFDEAEFLDDFYIDEIKNIEIFPAKQQIASSTQISDVPKMTVTEFLNEFDFDYEVKHSDEFDKPCWVLIDLQGAYLGNIGDDEFFDIETIVDRLDIYYDDYLMDGEWVENWEATLEELMKDNPRDWRIPYIYYILHADELIVDKSLSN